MKNKNTFKFLFAATLIGGCFTASAMESNQKILGEHLFEAARDGDLRRLNRLIRNGANVNYKIEEGTTALMAAAANDRLWCVLTLLDAQADPNIRSEETMRTALMYAGKACHNTFTQSNTYHEIVKLLLDAKADPNLTDRKKKTALMHAASAGNNRIVELLIKSGAELDAQDKYGNTALIYAAAGKCDAPNGRGTEHGTECVRLLVEANANVFIQNNREKDALLQAFSKLESERIDLLITAGSDLRPSIKHPITSNINFQSIITKRMNALDQQKNSAYALLWCMKQLAQDTICDKDFGLLIAERFLTTCSDQKQMLEGAIETLQQNEELRWLYNNSNQVNY